MNDLSPSTHDDPGQTKVALEALKLVGGGRALAHHDGDTWLVAGALPGETVHAVAEERRAGIVSARTVEVMASPSAARDPSPCPHAGECGGCDWPHILPDREPAFKRETAAEAARTHRELADRILEAPIRSSAPQYRLRVRLHWDPSAGRLGFFGPRSRRVASIPSCRIVSPRLARSLDALARLLTGRCPDALDVEWIEDLEGTRAVAALRPAAGQRREVDPRGLPAESDARDVVDGFHILSRRGRTVTGWGRTSVTMNLPVCISVPIGSFFQVNRHLAGWLFERVVQMTGTSSVPCWDLHAGVGYLAAAAHHAAPRELHLVEPFRPAARAAAANLPMAEVAGGRTAEEHLRGAGELPPEALVLTDPPRTGMSRELRNRLVHWRPHRIITLACDPATWSRDTAFLMENGYWLSHLELADLFPSTHHVEILAVLETG